MGIRVHKVLGYLVPGTVLGFETMRSDEMDLSDYFAWMKKHQDEIQAMVPEPFQESVYSRALHYIGSARDFHHKRAPNLSSCIKANERGDVWLLIDPAYYTEWHRYNDLIDWTEESALHDKQDHLHLLTDGIHPRAPGQVSPGVLGMCLLAGVPELASQLKEALYVYWG